MFRSSSILEIIGIAKNFNTTPSDIMGVDESEIYARYCIDDACNYIYNMMQPDKDGNVKEPQFIEEDKLNHRNPGLDLLLQ